ncbi:MAG: fumarylacetoacetate hydrolase family protein [Anaerolineae bacterium]|jgi:2-keto-4-pentenoate hydratase/2-oxohepta-3-ene-1,7-dioic acid hydratase in catechol pathway
MHFVTFRQDSNPRLGLLVDDHVLDLNLADPLLPTGLQTCIEMGTPALKRAADVLERWKEGQLASETARPRADLTFLAPIPAPTKVVAVGANYWDHCRECNIEPPRQPILFAKFPTAIVGPEAFIEWDPNLTSTVDYEAELAVVIGRRARRVSAADAFDVIYGYTCANDVSARDLQFGDGQWVRGKSLDTFLPLGPALVTRDEVPDPGHLRISCRIGDRVLQDSSTSEMIFGIPTLIEFITRAFTLLPGDVILTGTPHGTGAFREPKVFLSDGDVVEVEIERLGVLRNRCRESRGE